MKWSSSPCPIDASAGPRGPAVLSVIVSDIAAIIDCRTVRADALVIVLQASVNRYAIAQTCSVGAGCRREGELTDAHAQEADHGENQANSGFHR